MTLFSWGSTFSALNLSLPTLCIAFVCLGCGRLGFESDSDVVMLGPDGCVLRALYRDGDGDGYGTGASTMMSCTVPAGQATRGGDCNDRSSFVHPNARELCDTVDNDCDGRTDDGVCPVDGVGRFWEGRPYLRLDTTRVWSDARSQCLAAGMDLAHVDNAVENAMLWTFAQGQTAWLDGTDADVEGRWHWVHTGTVFWNGGTNGMAVAGIYNNWKPGAEPNNVFDEDCIAFWASYGDGTWADEACTRSYKVLCEGVP